jgi:hypothetical protein
MSESNETLSNETIGNFLNLEGKMDQGEHLQLGFHPNLSPLKEKWRNNGLSADFMADYIVTFFSAKEKHSNDVSLQAEIKSAVSYIANELLENAMKYTDNSANSVINISVSLILSEKQIILTESNSVTIDTAQNFKKFVQTLSQSDPMEMYLTQLEDSSSENISGLGFLTMINDYRAELAWQFQSANDPNTMTVFTEVRLPI